MLGKKVSSWNAEPAAGLQACIWDLYQGYATVPGGHMACFRICKELAKPHLTF